MRKILYALEFLIEVPEEEDLCNEANDFDNTACSGDCGGACDTYLFKKVKAWEQAYSEGEEEPGVTFYAASIMEYQE